MVHEQLDYLTIGRNVVIYLLGLALAIPGALGLANAIDLHWAIAAALFIGGLAIVIAVHEWLDGPV